MARGVSPSLPVEFHGEQALGRAYDARLLRRLWRFIRPYRRAFWLSLACLPLTSAFSLAQPYLLKIGIDRYVAVGDTRGLGVVGGLFIAALLGESLSYYWQYMLTMVVAQKSLADLRVELFAHVQRLPTAFFDRNPVGRVVTRLTTDIDVLNEMFAAGAMTVVMDFITLVGIVAIMLAIDARLALVSLATLPFMIVAIDFFRRAARRTYRAIRERIARINAYLQEAISGMSVIQLFAREERTYEEFAALNGAHRDANHVANIYEAALFSLVEAVSSISVALLLWYGGGRAAHPAVAFGTLVAFIEYIQKLFIPLRDFSTKYAVMQSSMAAAERIFQLLDTPPAPSPARPRRPRAMRGEIVFERVWFSYRNGGDGPVLRDLSFRIAPGERVAIVGPTGAGKTTIIKLLDRFYDVTLGRILVDGVDVREWDLAELRRRIGLVLQDVFLFSGDIAFNIHLGREGVSPGAVARAARRVHADAFIRRLRRGYGEPVAERGSNLSAGQRQLLSFARALAGDPAILVLDEATSSVDPETEWFVQDALAKLLQGRTALVIAHRLSTIENADRILVLHKGELREEGTHEELLRRGGIYARLCRLQQAGPGKGARSA